MFRGFGVYKEWYFFWGCLMFFFWGGGENGKNEIILELFFVEVFGGVDGQGEWCDEVLEQVALDILVDIGNFTH